MASVNNAGFLQLKQVNKPSLCMIVNSSQQEIIKVRERIPHIGSLTKVICLQLFLDMAPSFSEDVTRAMRGQPRRLSRNNRRRNGGNIIVYVLIVVRPGFCFICARLAVHYLALYSVLRSLISKV